MINQRYGNFPKTAGSQWMRWSFLILMSLAILTGFGQMPIFKRYYIADIPGLGWLAQFYVTHFLHYLFGTLILGILGFIVAQWIIEPQARQRLSMMGKSYIGVLAGILLTGVMLALKNFSGYLYPPSMIIVLNLVHLGLVMMWFFLSLLAVVFKYHWTREI